MRQKSERADAIVDLNDDSSLMRKRRTVVDRNCNRSFVESSAVHVHQHGQASDRGLLRRPDVQEQAVFTDSALMHVLRCPGQAVSDNRLNTSWNSRERFAAPAPTRRRLRLSPAQRTCWCCGVWNAAI